MSEEIEGQMSLEGTAEARSTDPETSHEAAASIGGVTKVQVALLRLFKTNGPLCDEEMVRVYEHYTTRGNRAFPQASASGLRTRRSELVARGLLADSKLRTTMESGRRAIIWKITEPGRDFLDGKTTTTK